jgi:methyl-accepting chemotaxis protein
MGKVDLSKRIQLLFIALMTLIVGSLAATYFLGTAAQRNIDVDVTNEIGSNILEAQQQLNSYIISGDTNIAEPFRALCKTNDEFFEALESGGSIKLGSERLETRGAATQVTLTALDSYRSNWRKFKAAGDTLLAYPVQQTNTQNATVTVATSDSTSVDEQVSYEVSSRSFRVEDQSAVLMALYDELVKQTRFIQLLFLDEVQESAKGNVLLISTLLATMLVVVGLLYSLLQHFLQRPLRKMIATTKQLAKGDAGVELDYDGNDELGELAEGLRGVVANMKEATNFVQGIGKSEFETSFEVKGEQDVLGASLMSMRDELLKISEQDEKRNWATTGHALFGEILREFNDDLAAFGSRIITELVRYSGTNQGGLFLVQEREVEGGKDTNIELIASYAYDREKFLKRDIGPGEGLVGQCYLERKTIYMTNLPDEYVHIRSGLGSENPSCLLIVPLMMNDEIQGVLELTSFNTLEDYQIEFIEKLGESLGSTLATVQISATTKKLLSESQAMTESIQSQEEEMRQNLEELQATQEEMARKQQEMNVINERYELINKATNEGHWDIVTPLTGQVDASTELWCSDYFLELLGVTRKALKRKVKSWFDLIHEDDKATFDGVWDAFVKANKTKQVLTVEVRMQFSGKDYRWYRVQGNSVKGGAGKTAVLRFAGTITDITEQQEREAAFKALEEKVKNG